MLDKKFDRFYFPAIILLVLIVSISYSRLDRDDEYIYYTYAKNISQGRGYEFNTGERINATTSPLYTLLISSLNYVTGPDNYKKIPLIGKLVSFLSLLLLVFISYRIMRVSGFRYAGYFFALLILVNPYLKNSAGMETLFALMLLTATVYLYMNRNFNLMAITGALAVLARFDSILLILVILIHYLVTMKSFPKPVTIILFVITILPWFIFSYFYFNDIFPSTLWIKTHQQALGYWGNGYIFIKGFMTSVPGGIYSSSLLLGIFAICLYYLFTRKKELFKKNFIAVFLLWFLLYFISYGLVLNPPGYPWYYSAFIIPFGVVVSVAIESFMEVQSGKGFLILFIFIFTIGLVLPIKTFIHPGRYKYEVYSNTARFLNKSSSNSSVLIDEIGIFGFYYTNGKVIDLLGLINPEIEHYIEHKDYKGIFGKYHPDFVVVDYPERPEYENFIKKKEFLEIYHPVKIISNSDKAVQIYSRK